jgi:NADH dehydrogenase/NADH:ubiquinone oxidoreductase subunit G
VDSSSSKQIHDGLAHAVARDVEGALFDFVGQARRDAQRVVNAGVQIFDDHPVLDRFARTRVGGHAVQMAALDPAAKKQDAAGVGEMPVHAVKLQVLHRGRLIHLVFDRLVRACLPAARRG